MLSLSSLFYSWLSENTFCNMYIYKRLVLKRLPLCPQILFERVTFDQRELREAIRIIDKDVPRTNRDLNYYQ